MNCNLNFHFFFCCVLLLNSILVLALFASTNKDNGNAGSCNVADGPRNIGIAAGVFGMFLSIVMIMAAIELFSFLKDKVAQITLICFAVLTSILMLASWAAIAHEIQNGKSAGCSYSGTWGAGLAFALFANILFGIAAYLIYKQMAAAGAPAAGSAGAPAAGAPAGSPAGTAAPGKPFAGPAPVAYGDKAGTPTSAGAPYLAPNVTAGPTPVYGGYGNPTPTPGSYSALSPSQQAAAAGISMAGPSASGAIQLIDRSGPAGGAGVAVAGPPAAGSGPIMPPTPAS
eukprot:gnl/Hemi2/151_TR41_c0_g1_i1.p1 gnl/Hemi2/151_TR41_c0_g1~~gnl/Hemi2/151_TR41_c0_g1_i1.p1  ORF type:complete len:285 (+),score=77.12 gnl/Hemi2/151_TR41_c0_g1_i1:144-998(+)